MVRRDIFQLFERFDGAEHDPVILVRTVEELGEIDVIQVETVDLIRFLDGASDAQHDEDLLPRFVHGTLVIGELIIGTPDDASIRFRMGTVLDLHPELPACHFVPETEVRIDHGMDVPSAGIVLVEVRWMSSKLS